jgi:hypothetical protein
MTTRHAAHDTHETLTRSAQRVRIDHARRPTPALAANLRRVLAHPSRLQVIAVTATGPVYAVPARVRALPPAAAWLRISELHARALGHKGPFATASAATLTPRQAFRAYSNASLSALMQLAVVGPGARARMLRSLVDHVTLHRSLAGVEGIFVSAMRAAQHAGDREGLALGRAAWNAAGAPTALGGGARTSLVLDPATGQVAFAGGQIASLGAGTDEEGLTGLGGIFGGGPALPGAGGPGGAGMRWGPGAGAEAADGMDAVGVCQAAITIGTGIGAAIGLFSGGPPGAGAGAGVGAGVGGTICGAALLVAGVEAVVDRSASSAEGDDATAPPGSGGGLDGGTDPHNDGGSPGGTGGGGTDGGTGGGDNGSGGSGEGDINYTPSGDGPVCIEPGGSYPNPEGDGGMPGPDDAGGNDGGATGRTILPGGPGVAAGVTALSGGTFALGGLPALGDEGGVRRGGFASSLIGSGDPAPDDAGAATSVHGGTPSLPARVTGAVDPAPDLTRALGQALIAAALHASATRGA